MATGTPWGNPKERRARLIEVLRAASNEADCRVCLDRLDEYVAAQLAGQDYTVRFPEVATHLDACLDCTGAYARLYELALAEASDTLPQPAHVPEPDLSFLLPDASGFLSPSALRARLKADELTNRLRAALQRTGQRLTLRLSTELLPLLRPSPAMPALRAPADAERYAEVLLNLVPDEVLRSDLPITLTAYRDARRPEECLVEVIVEPPGRSWPELEGVTVALVIGGERREAVTDAWGLAAFEGVAVALLADMAVEVTLPTDM